MSDVDTSAGRRFLIKKNGYYYRPNSKGYTSSAILAGRYTMEEAEDITHPNGPDGPRDGMSFIAEHICPDEDWQAYMALRTQLAEAQKPAPKGYPINLLVSGTIQAHQIAEDLGSGKIDKMEPFTRYDAARNALAEARDSALEEAAAIFEEEAKHDWGGIQYSQDVGIPISNYDQLVKSATRAEQNAAYIRALKTQTQET
ncbi:MAG: hypothetical protein Unbinned7865contig1001_36 [Prokaryotic dsDNA virus sp.]|nr:MAG: hypothetical protein Unbinned7865contig1001_36 [Prokaryotic dsDNA virus sp.]|tara:strand:- start:6604 stop:7203 length:600 start_codon:yes stop_codon:yes gene_type:complete